MFVSTAVCANRLPEDVQKFIEKRELCDHFRGEYPEPEGWGSSYQTRLDEVNKAIKETCQGTDQALVKLKQQYKDDTAIMNQLNEFEENIGL